MTNERMPEIFRAFWRALTAKRTRDFARSEQVFGVRSLATSARDWPGPHRAYSSHDSAFADAVDIAGMRRFSSDVHGLRRDPYR